MFFDSRRTVTRCSRVYALIRRRIVLAIVEEWPVMPS